MKRLLRAEFQVLGNLFQHAAGRRVLIINALALLYFAWVAGMLGAALFGGRPLQDALRGEGGLFLLRPLLAVAFLPALLLVFLSGVKAAEKLLFTGGDIDFLVAAPLPRGAVVARAWLRLVLLNWLWGCSLCWPMVILLVERSRGAGLAIALVPLVVLFLCLPVLAAVVFVHVLLMRFFAGPRVKLALGAVLGLLYLVFVLLLLLGFTGSDRVLTDFAARVPDLVQQHPWAVLVVDGPAWLLAWAAGAPWDGAILLKLAALAGAALLLLLLAGWMYPAAFENERVALAPALGRRVGRRFSLGRSWPAGLTSSLFRKDLTQVLRQPGKLLGILVFSMLLIFLGNSPLMEPIVDPPASSRAAAIPEGVRHATALFTLFYWVMGMALPGMVIGIVSTERKHWPLLAAAPAGGPAILRGKLGFPLANLLLYLLAALLAGALLYRASALGLLAFLVLAAPAIYGCLGLTTALATIPPLARPTAGETGHVVRNVLAAMLIMGAMVLMALPGFDLWKELTKYYSAGHGQFRGMAETTVFQIITAAVWGAGILLGFVGFRVAGANLKRLAGPAPE